MKKHLLLFGLMLFVAQPAFSQCPLGGCPQAQPQMSQQMYQQPMLQQQAAPAYQAACPTCPQAAAPVYQAACPCPQTPCCPQTSLYVIPNFQPTGAAAAVPRCCPEPRSWWDQFVEDFLGFNNN